MGANPMLKRMGRSRVDSSPYSKQGLSSDARVIWALLKKQPQSRDELCKNAGLSRSTFYSVRPLLESQKILKGNDEEGYTLWAFSPLKNQIEDALFRLIKKGYAFGLEELESEVGKPWSEIESETFKILKDYGLRIRLVDGQKRIEGWTWTETLFRMDR